ncbi:MAG: NUDIX domain-containing protein [Silicimonas sp.]|nr:NUDIX domain-containing protein [Silicimonas sp.]
MNFHGAKLAILVGDSVVSILREDIQNLDYAGHWDLPGGGRERGETPQACVLREVHEELGLSLSSGDLTHAFACQSKSGTSWFFISHQPDFDPSQVRFGDEGERWDLVKTSWFLTEARAVPVLSQRLRNFLEKGHPCA